ncbi:MAG: hypothetical protein ACNA71_01035 [Kiritimatiellia bacterium]
MHGSRLVLRIQAANPTDVPRTVDVRSSLPERVTTNDIINLAGLDLGYDVKSDTYYVYGSLNLGPREIAVRNVEIADIWLLDADEVLRYGTHAERLGEMLRSTQYQEEGVSVAADAGSLVQQILRRQQENRISVVGPLRHIQAYEENVTANRSLRQMVGRLENLVLASGMNPGAALIGEDRMAAPPRQGIHIPVEYGEASVVISVHNPSATQTRRDVEIRRALPPEVRVEDVLDAGGLMVRFDPQEQVTYVYGSGIEIGPGQTLSFDVRIRDKWNINVPRIAFLDQMLARLRAVTAGRSRLAAVANTLDDIERRLQSVRLEVGPESLNPAYIAFYRRQSDRLDDIERDLNRVDSALNPLETRRGFTIPAPDRKTTWVLIYAILGFLALLSLLFFLRWFVKSN